VTEAETSPDVCYRHPNRESWVLCQRCGRTICPECQILSPAGVQCPECIKETGGSVSWRGAGETRRPVAKLSKSRRTQQGRSGGSSGGSSGSFWQSQLGQMLRPGSEAPVLSWGTVAVVIVLWIAGLVTGGLPELVLGFPSASVVWQIWRFFTTAVTYPAFTIFLISVLLNSVFFLLTAPAVERQLGRGRTLVVMLAAAGLGSSSMVLAGTAPYGLSGVLFGVFGAYLIFVWSHPQARTQGLIIIGFNLMIVLFFSPVFLPQIIGGLLAGAGATYLFQRYDGRSRSNPRTPYLIIGAGVAGFILMALLRTYAF
jgi:membrane associated rhomboid family serine protease